MGLKNNWKTLVDGVDDASAEQINQIAEAVVDIEEEMEQQPDVPEIDLSDYVKKEEVFETSSFGWTDFPYDVEAVEWDNDYSLSDTQIMGGGAKFTIHCKGKTLGFDYTLDNTNASYIEINGVRYTSGNGSVPLTFVESDVIVYCSLSVYEFSNMVQQSIKGVSEIEAQIGDIDTALDELHNYAQSLVGGGTV